MKRNSEYRQNLVAVLRKNWIARQWTNK